MTLNLAKLILELDRLRKDLVGWDSEDAANCAITSIEIKSCDPEKDQYADLLVFKVELTENAKAMKTNKELASVVATMEIPLEAEKEPTTITLTKTSKVP